MKVNCLYCGHAFGIDDSYCDYEGLLRCATCSGLLDVVVTDGLIRSVRPGSLTQPQNHAPHSQGTSKPAPPAAPAQRDVQHDHAEPQHPATTNQAPNAA